MDNKIFMSTLRPLSLAVLLPLSYNGACKSQTNSPKSKVEKNPGENERIDGEKAKEDKSNGKEPVGDTISVCRTPTGASGNPKTIEDFIKLVNALPKPVSTVCAIDALDGPFSINATANFFSGQPAHSREFPRIFLFMGDRLIISIVPKGEGSRVIEFGYKVEDGNSIKGELHFPVMEMLKDDSAYTSILDSSGTSTNCRICHSPEIAAPADFPSTAFASKYVPADSYYNVPLTKLKMSHENCAQSETEECLLLRVIYKKGVREGTF